MQGVQVGQYLNLVPLDDPTQQGKRNWLTLGVPTSLYKVTAESDGEVYTLRRLEGPPVPDGVIQQYGRMWVSMKHPNICRLIELFNSADVRLGGLRSACPHPSSSMHLLVPHRSFLCVRVVSVLCLCSPLIWRSE